MQVNGLWRFEGCKSCVVMQQLTTSCLRQPMNRRTSIAMALNINKKRLHRSQRSFRQLRKASAQQRLATDAIRRSQRVTGRQAAVQSLTIMH